MDKYEVLLYPKAFRDIENIYAYIALEKRVFVITVQYQGRND